MRKRGFVVRGDNTGQRRRAMDSVLGTVSGIVTSEVASGNRDVATNREKAHGHVLSDWSFIMLP